MFTCVLSELRRLGHLSRFSATWVLRTLSVSARVKQKMGVECDWEFPVSGDGDLHAKIQEATAEVNKEYIWAPDTRHICQRNWRCVELAITALKEQKCPFGICFPKGNRSPEAQPIACVVLALNRWYRLRDLRDIFPCELGITNGSRGLLLHIHGDPLKPDGDPLKPDVLLMYFPTYRGPCLLSSDVWQKLKRSSVVQQAMRQEPALRQEKIVPIVRKKLQDFGAGTVLVIYLHFQHNNCEIFKSCIYTHTGTHTARGPQLTGPDAHLEQFPVELNTATTAASALGYEFDRVFGDLGRCDFALFNALVILSRATSWEKLTLADFDVSRLTGIMNQEDKRKSFQDVKSFVDLLKERCSSTTEMIKGHDWQRFCEATKEKHPASQTVSLDTVNKVLQAADKEKERVAEDMWRFQEMKKAWNVNHSWQSVFQKFEENPYCSKRGNRVIKVVLGATTLFWQPFIASCTSTGPLTLSWTCTRGSSVWGIWRRSQPRKSCTPTHA